LSVGGVGQQRPVAPPGAAAGALAKWACAQADLASASSHRAVHRGARHVANGSRRAAVRLPHCRLLGPPLHPGYSGQAGGDSHRPRAGTRVHVQVLEHRREDIYHCVLPGCELVERSMGCHLDTVRGDSCETAAVPCCGGPLEPKGSLDVLGSVCLLHSAFIYSFCLVAPTCRANVWGCRGKCDSV
jgi:hypothetical protein